MDEIFSFGYWVKRRRKALDLTQAALAHEVGCAAITIRKIENDQRRPSRTMVERLAKCLEIPNDERETFILSGLGDVSAYRMPMPSESISIASVADDRLQSEEIPSILAGRSKPKNNLPIQAIPLIGRVNELAEIRAKLTQDTCRLLNLLGPGGSGKTRLAIEAAGELLADYQDGIFFVSLAPVQSVEVIPSSIASALRFSFHDEGTPEEQLIDYLRNKQMLLILDNFEHLLDGACLVLEILNAAPGVKILVTSRTRLMVTGEHILDVWGMAFPETSVSVEKALDRYSAIKLFEAQASRVQGEFELSDDNLEDVIQVCALLDGMPLGIVLAASWLAMLHPAEIAAEIVRDLEFLEKDLRDLPQRQRGMRSVFNHSWRLLSDREQKILSALSVFKGGFSRKAAGEVVDASLSDLMGLIDKSMLQRSAKGRFEVHELMRQFAGEKLENDPKRNIYIRSKHSETYLQALVVWERNLQSPQQIEAHQEMRVEIDNIRAAWVWAVGTLKIKSLAGAINGFCIFLFQNHQRIEGDEVCQILVDRLNIVDDPDKSSLLLKARALAWGGIFTWKLGHWNRADELLQKCLATLKCSKLVDVDTRFEKAIIHLTQTMITEKIEHHEIIKMIEDIEALFMSIGEPWWAGWALIILGERAKSTAEGLSIYEKSLKIARELGDLRGIADSLVQLAVQYALKWQLEKGEVLALEALEIYRTIGDQHGMAFVSANLGGGLVWQGRFKEARSMECATLELYANLGYQQSYFAWLYAGAAFPDLYLGEYPAAREQARYARGIYKKVKHYMDRSWTAGVKDILGRAALAEGAYAEAEDWFQECDAVFREFYNPGDAANYAQNLTCLGLANRGLKRPAQAQGYLYRALQVAIEYESYLAIYHILPGIALLYVDQDQVERAVEIYVLAATQGIVANSKWFDDIAGDEIAAAAEELPPEIVETAKARGRGLDLWETAGVLLNEFNALGSKSGV